ncbi:MAG TPA: helix-turn-helix transcriptional regulator [Actinocrinis sp.]|nr:helix-turn-helix transcriptional regulator [Actinocrinis sp.]
MNGQTVNGAGELGTMLRAWRDRMSPGQVGLSVNAPRRAAGLRREELAVLSGVSADYLVRLEQGRATAPSAQVCAALARALQLSDVEQSHLFRLSGHAGGDGLISRQIPASVRRLTERLDDHPLAVYDAMWNLVLWNRLWAALLGDPSVLAEYERNVLWRHFVGGGSRVEHAGEDGEAFEAAAVGDLRSAVGRYPDDSDLRGLIEDLTRASSRFREVWARNAVAHHDQATKTVIHPQVGRIELDCDVLASQRGDLRIVVYTPHAGTDAEAKLDLLAAIGAQTVKA